MSAGIQILRLGSATHNHLTAVKLRTKSFSNGVSSSTRPVNHISGTREAMGSTRKEAKAQNQNQDQEETILQHREEEGEGGGGGGRRSTRKRVR